MTHSSSSNGKTWILFCLLVMAISTTAFSQKFTKPVDYNDFIVGLQNRVAEKIIEFNAAMGEENIDFEGVQPYYNALVTVSEEVFDKMKTSPVFEGNVGFRDAAINLFGFYERMFKAEYKEMIDLVLVQELTEASLERINKMLESITAEEGKLDEAFSTQQKAFADKYGFSLEENKLQDEIGE